MRGFPGPEQQSGGGNPWENQGDAVRRIYYPFRYAEPEPLNLQFAVLRSGLERERDYRSPT
jgi:hypothetical protein